MDVKEEYGGIDTLAAWQKARELVQFIHRRVTPVLPNDEKWDLTDQIRRSSKSVMANIAEGYGRFYYQETLRFCYIARGSLMETYSHLITASDLDYIAVELCDEGKLLVENVHRTLNGYIAYIKRNKRGGELPGGRLQESSTSYIGETDHEFFFESPNPQSLTPQSPQRGEQ